MSPCVSKQQVLVGTLIVVAIASQAGLGFFRPNRLLRHAACKGFRVYVV